MPEQDKAGPERKLAVANLSLIAAGVAGVGALVSCPDLPVLGYLWGGLSLAAIVGTGLALRGARLPFASCDTPSSPVPDLDLTPSSRKESEARFLSSMGHDLRQPVQAIALFSATLETHPLPDASRKLVSGIGSAVELLSRQLEAVFSIAKLESGRVTVQPSSVSLNSLLASTVSAHIDTAHEIGVHLRHVATRRFVLADPTHLARILDGMVMHALAVTKDGGVVVGSRHRRGKCVIEVWDSSPGVRPDWQESALAPGSSYSKVLQDKGLGLVLADRLAALLGGTLKFESREGKGSVLRLTLPIAEGSKA